jgi:hypothetical protein
MLGLRVGAEEATAPVRVFVGDRETHDAGVEVPHLQKVVANDA